MFNRIPTVLMSQEIIDKCFSRASKIEEPYQLKVEEKIRKEIIDRISTIESISCGHLDKLVKKFPKIEDVHPFYRDLLDLLFDIDHYKISLYKMSETSVNIVKFSTIYIRKAKGAQKAEDLNKIMRAFYGRFSSLINDLKKDLEFLRECRDYMSRIPTIDTKVLTFIISGMPNVGKSSLIRSITNTNPKVAQYPFTTQSIHVGVLDMDNERFQLVDTPGILDRPMEERNEMEIKAIMALKHIDGIIMFLFDYSESSGYSVQDQERLYDEIVRTFRKPIIRVQAKSDLGPDIREKIAISTMTGDGLEDLKRKMFEFRVIHSAY